MIRKKDGYITKTSDIINILDLIERPEIKEWLSHTDKIIEGMTIEETINLFVSIIKVLLDDVGSVSFKSDTGTWAVSFKKKKGE